MIGHLGMYPVNTIRITKYFNDNMDFSLRIVHSIGVTLNTSLLQ